MLGEVKKHTHKQELAFSVLMGIRHQLDAKRKITALLNTFFQKEHILYKHVKAGNKICSNTHHGLHT